MSDKLNYESNLIMVTLPLTMPRDKLYELTSNILSEIDQIIVAGDIHGDYESFSKIYELFDPKRDHLVLLGDYADRGPRGVEVIDDIKGLLKKHPERVTALKGNHEDYTNQGKPMFSPCTLIREAKRKRSSMIAITSYPWKTYFEEELKPFLDGLYLAALIPEKVLFIHGGVSSKIQSINDLRHPSNPVEKDILWSDPFDGNGEHLSRRGAGVEFGKDVTEEICQKLDVKRIVRSHQPRKARKEPYVEHNSKIITISSTAIYGGVPFVLTLPTENLNRAFNNLEKHTTYL